MSAPPTSGDASPYAALAGLLRRRLEVIADHAWRDRDPEGHLDALREVSTALDAEAAQVGSVAPARLRHFLQQRSYEKALDFIGEAGGV